MIMATTRLINPALAAYRQVRRAASTTTLSAIFICFLCQKWQSGSAASLGIVVWVIPNLYVAWRLFSQLEKPGAAKLLNAFYRAELVKWLLIGGFFLTASKLLPIAS